MKTSQRQAPSVSVVVPLFEHGRYIASALESALGQSLPPREVIVVDDGSRDDGPEVVRRLARSDARIVFWSQPNQDAYFALNAGIHRATGDVIAILNSDDAYEPRRLERCVAALVSSPAVGLVATGLSFIDDAGSEVDFPWYDEARAFHRRIEDAALALINGNFVMTTSNFVVRRSLFKEIGGFARLRYAHDLDFLLRVLDAGRHIHLLDEPLVRYRVHARNTIREEHRKVRREWAAATAAFIHNRLARRGGVPEWADVRRVYEIVERHDLVRLLSCFLLHFARTGERPARADSFVDAPEFQAFLEALGL